MEHYRFSFDELTFMLELYQQVCVSNAKAQKKRNEPIHCDANCSQFVYSFVNGIDKARREWIKAANDGKCEELAKEIAERMRKNEN